MNRLTIIFFAVLFSSCASTSQFVKFTGQSAELGTQKSRIYVLRSGTMKGAAVKMPIYCNNELIGKLGSKSYLCWDVEEGSYAITSSTEGGLIGKNATENKDYFTINAKPGKTYYIQQNPKMGYSGYAKVSLTVISESEGKKLLSKLKKPTVNYAEQ